MNATNTEPESDPKLGSEFTPHTYDEWKAAAEELLKGAPFEKRMITPTYEGFDLEPIYMRDVLEKVKAAAEYPGADSHLRSSRASGYLKNGWAISQELTGPTPKAFNETALSELEKGQDELNIWLDAPTRAGLDPDAAAAETVGVCGLSLATAEDVAVAFKGIYLDSISVYWRPGLAAVPVAASYFAYVKRAGINPKDLRGCFECDPVAYLVEHGKLPYSIERALDEMAALTKFCLVAAPRMQTIGVQGHAYHNGGGSSVQEMASVLATGVYYLRAMQARGLEPDLVAPRMRLALSIGPNFFLEIAKFRAMRRLWTEVLKAFGVAEDKQEIHLHARTGLWNKTVFDPYVNMLRGTTEAFSAVVGGVDSLHISAFDEIIRESDAFSRRIARNVHHILGEECEMKRVIDPAGGSWAVESLTHQMADEAWKCFQSVESKGGALDALVEGYLQGEIEKVSGQKQANIAKRRDVLVGTNMYPNSTEKLLTPREVDYAAVQSERAEHTHYTRGSGNTAAVEQALTALEQAILKESHSAAVIEQAVAAAAAGATIGELSCTLRKGAEEELSVQPVRLKRGAAQYEELRQASRAFEAKTGEAPLVFQANMGPSRRYRLRADWTAAFFQAGGLKVLGDDDFDGVDAAVAAAEKSGARVVVITSDDETYTTVVPELAKKLKEKLPDALVLLAGAAGDNEAAWREAGVDDFVHVRVNTYETLKNLLNRLEVL